MGDKFSEDAAMLVLPYTKLKRKENDSHRDHIEQHVVVSGCPVCLLETRSQGKAFKP